jgi:hypothetical protein
MITAVRAIRLTIRFSAFSFRASAEDFHQCHPQLGKSLAVFFATGVFFAAMVGTRLTVPAEFSTFAPVQKPKPVRS